MNFAAAAGRYRNYLKLAPDAPDAEDVRARLADAEKRASEPR